MSSNRTHMLRISTIRANDRGRCKNEVVGWGALCDKLKAVQVDQQHTQAQYDKLSVDEKNKVKDVGSYVLGPFKDNVRKARNIEIRSGIALDIDNATNEQIEFLKMGLSDVCQYEFAAVTSRSHTSKKPKYRLVFPLHKAMPADYYTAASRILASRLFATVSESMDATDDVSYRVAQIMYWPSRSKNGPFDFYVNEGAILDWESLLASFPGWEDYSQLPFSAERGIVRPGQKAPAQRPYDKQGLVGAFCRSYSVPEAIERFLPDVYVRPQKEGKKVRYTYAKGHGSKGAIVEDGGLFLYSHHGTDPCGERLVNAFDMVRLHLFGEEDASKADDTTPTQLPSFKAMREFLTTDRPTQVMQKRMADERIDAHFEDLDPLADDEPGGLSDLSGGSAKPLPASITSLLDDDALDILGDADPDYDEILGTTKARPGTAGEDTGIPKYVQALNERHAFVMLSGKAAILHESRPGIVEFGPVESFYQMYANKRVPKDAIDEPVSAAWMRSEFRRQYMAGIVFDPTYTGTTAYNLWGGFEIEPDPNASCDLLLSHMREIMCAGNERDYRYLLGWLAHMIQKPEQKPGVAIVFKGLKGVGKDTLGEYISRMIERYYLNVSNPDYIYGKHNTQLERCLFLHLEEAYWAGDRRHEPLLKALITGPTQFIEPKGVNGYRVKSIIRLMMSSNDDWVVPASSDERRFFVQNVRKDRKGDRAYFDALRAEMNGKGPAALLHLLMTYDLTGFDVFTAPDTLALAEQKAMSHKNVTLWWRDLLEEGSLGALEQVDGDEGPAWEKGQTVQVGRDQLFASYIEFMRSKRWGGETLDRAVFGRRLREMCPELTDKQLREKGTGRRFRFYVLPGLAACRAAFERFTGSDFPWPDPET